MVWKRHLKKWLLISCRFRTSRGSRSTFEFPIRVNLSCPSLYCTARTLSTWLVGATRLTRSDLMLHIGWIYFYWRGRGAWHQKFRISYPTSSPSEIYSRFKYFREERDSNKKRGICKKKWIPIRKIEKLGFNEIFIKTKNGICMKKKDQVKLK